MSRSIKTFFKTGEQKQTDTLPPSNLVIYNLENNQGSILEPNLPSASNVVKELTQFHPNDDYIFPKKTVGKKQRSCQSSWFKKFSWLHYDQRNDSVFCILCIKHSEKLTIKMMHMLKEVLAVGRKHPHALWIIRCRSVTKQL